MGPMKRNLILLSILIVILSFLGGCVGIPVRKEVRVDLSLPVGKIDGNTFQGIRFPFKISPPSPQWQFSLEIPDFMEGLGFKRAGLEEDQLFLINPVTKSNVQIDLTPAGRRVRFSQKLIETLTRSAAGGLVEELKADYGRNFPVEVGPTTPYSLKGVQYAAHRFVKYKLGETRVIHGWVYGFEEPYQIFIIYMALEKEGFDDSKEIMKILNSFEVISKK
jgi:hypothetical protein